MPTVCGSCTQSLNAAAALVVDEDERHRCPGVFATASDGDDRLQQLGLAGAGGAGDQPVRPVLADVDARTARRRTRRPPPGSDCPPHPPARGDRVGGRRLQLQDVEQPAGAGQRRVLVIAADVAQRGQRAGQPRAPGRRDEVGPDAGSVAALLLDLQPQHGGRPARRPAREAGVGAPVWLSRESITAAVLVSAVRRARPASSASACGATCRPRPPPSSAAPPRRPAAASRRRRSRRRACRSCAACRHCGLRDHERLALARQEALLGVQAERVHADTAGPSSQQRVRRRAASAAAASRPRRRRCRGREEPARLTAVLPAAAFCLAVEDLGQLADPGADGLGVVPMQDVGVLPAGRPGMRQPADPVPAGLRRSSR